MNLIITQRNLNFYYKLKKLYCENYYFIAIIKMDSQENLGNINDTYDDSQIIEEIKSFNITNKREDKNPPNESKTLREISNSNYIKN